MNKNFMMKIIGLLQLSRIGMAPLTISVPISSYILLGQANLQDVLLLGVVGLCAHIFGFALNDVIDYPIDKHVPYRQASPLGGLVSRTEALLFCSAQIPISLFVYIFLLNGTGLGIAVLIASIALSLIYNLWSKLGRLSRILSEISLAASIGLLALAGRMTIREPAIGIVDCVYGLSLALILLSVNSVASGLKDLKTDAKNGAISFMISMGCCMVDDDRVYISHRLYYYAIVVKVLISVTFFILAILLKIHFQYLFLIILLTTYGWLHSLLILRLQSFRGIVHSSPLLNGFYDYFALLGFISPQMPLSIFIVFLLISGALILYPISIGHRMRRVGYIYLPK